MSVSDTVAKVKETILQYTKDPSFPSTGLQLLLGVVISFVLLSLINLMSMVYRRVKNSVQASPFLIRNTKDASVLLRVPQDPNDPNSTPLKRSFNEGQGIEFTYMTWMYIGDYNYQLGNWKHVFHKGNSQSWPNRAPGVWLHPTVNALRVYMNSYQQINEYVDIFDIPIGKWFHFALVVSGTNLDLYINGYLKKRYVLSSTCKQNFGDLWINANGGFRGYLSRFRYFDYAVPFATISSAVSYGPSMNMPNTALQSPAYLPSSWYLKN